MSPILNRQSHSSIRRRTDSIISDGSADAVGGVGFDDVHTPVEAIVDPLAQRLRERLGESVGEVAGHRGS